MREIDGRAGGGQLVRTAVALSAVTETSVEMTNVRGARETPGLRPQHVTAVETVAAVANATTTDVEEGSGRFVFEPGRVVGGEYEARIGTAGSVTLVFDALLPLATRIDDRATVSVSGGTDVKWSPPYDYFRHVKLPALGSHGLDAATTLERRGFYPRGGGSATLVLRPSRLDRLELGDRGDLQSIAVHSVATESLRSADVADRQAKAASDELAGAVSVPIDTDVAYVEALDTGSVVVLVATYAATVAGFTALGEPGKPSEDVATTAVSRFLTFEDGAAAVDPHLADQVVPFLALAGGRVRIPELSEHVRTAVDLVRDFDLSVRITDVDGPGVVLEAPGAHDQGTTP
ncbi:MAG: RNA 3'-terminal phosphate cyclase [Halanaeroarchaeum sp.]